MLYILDRSDYTWSPRCLERLVVLHMAIVGMQTYIEGLRVPLHGLII